MLVREYFEATVPVWEEIYREPTLYAAIYRERLGRALALAEAVGPEGGEALDVGCGPGLGSVGLAERGFRVHAVDALPAMVERTLGRARDGGLDGRVTGAVAELGALPFSGWSFDLVFLIGVSEWLEALGPALVEAARVLRPGGHLILSADNAWALSCLVDPLQHPMVVPLKRALGRVVRRLWPARRPVRTHAWSRRALDRALGAAGLDVTDGLTLGFGPFTWLRQPLLSERLGQQLDHHLRAVSWLGWAGLVHLVVARKPSDRDE